MFNFRKLILLFSVMVMGIIGVKANPKYYIVIIPSNSNDKEFESAQCDDCKCYLSKCKEQLTECGDMYIQLYPIVYYNGKNKVKAVKIDKDTAVPYGVSRGVTSDDQCCYRGKNSVVDDCYFTVVDDDDKDIRCLCLLCMIKSVGFKNLIDVKELGSMCGGYKLIEYIEKYGRYKEYRKKFLRCVFVNFTNLEDLKNPKCCVCQSGENEISDIKCSQAQKHIEQRDMCVADDGICKNHVLLMCHKCSLMIHHGCLISWMQKSHKLNCPVCKSHQFEHSELYRCGSYSVLCLID